jgi:hypothetical protein
MGRVWSRMAVAGAASFVLFPGLLACNSKPSGTAPPSHSLLTVELVASGFEQPLLVTAPPGDAERLFVAERRGRLR